MGISVWRNPRALISDELKPLQGGAGGVLTPPAVPPEGVGGKGWGRVPRPGGDLGGEREGRAPLGVARFAQAGNPGHGTISGRPRLDKSDHVYFARTVSATRFSRSKRLASRAKCNTWATTCVQPWTKYTHPSSTLTLREAACASA